MTNRRTRFVLLAGLLLPAVPADPLLADAAGYSERPAARPLDLPAYAEPPPGEPFRLPPITDAPAAGQNGGPRFRLREVRIEGNTVFSDEVLQRDVVSRYLDRPVTVAELESLRLDLTRYYEEHGYPNSGALLPAQHIQNGRVTFRVVEGRLSEVRVDSSSQWLNPEYVRERILWEMAGEPLNRQRLGERFQLLLTDPVIARLNGTLRPGATLGDSLLDLDVTTGKRFELAMQFDNHRPAGTGAETGRLVGTARSLTGWGDALSFELGRSEGAGEGSVAWSLPLSPRDTRLNLSYSESRSSVVEEPLAAADIDSLARTWSVGLDYPLWREVTGGLTLGARLEQGYSRTWLLGRGEPLSPGVEPDGSARVSALRFVQDYSRRGPDAAFAARSTLSVGLDALAATIHPELPDSRFVTWIGQLRQAWRRQGGDQLLLRGDVQWSNDGLLPLEQLAVGGASTVRGYRENQLVRDQGYIVSAEYRRPFAATGDAEGLQWVLFSDAGGAWYQGEADRAVHLWSVGVGLRWDWKRLHAAVDWGYRLKPVPEPLDHDLQDDGVHLSLRFDLL